MIVSPIPRGEVVVVSVGVSTWWVHTFDRHGDGGQLISSHRNKRMAIATAARASHELDLDMKIWGDDERG
jgi:hypothetical protein